VELKWQPFGAWGEHVAPAKNAERASA